MTAIKTEIDDDTYYQIEVTGNGRKHRNIYISHDLHNKIITYLKERDETSKYLFTSKYSRGKHITTATVRKNLKNICTKADHHYKNKYSVNYFKNRVTPHILRHSHAMYLLKHDTPITVLKDMLGHSNIATTSIYIEAKKKDIQHAYKNIYHGNNIIYNNTN